MRRDVRRQRAALATYPPIPDVEDALFHIPHRYTVSGTGNVFFLQYDNNRADRILNFGTNDSLNFLQNSENLLMEILNRSVSVCSIIYCSRAKSGKAYSWRVWFTTKQEE